MANGTPLSLDPSQIEILLAGNLAADDLMWVVRCSIEELHLLFKSPVEWVAALGSLPGWSYVGESGPSPAPALSRDFAMLVQETKVEDPDGWVTVQGISETNAITIVAAASSGIRSLLATDSLADAVAEKLAEGLDPYEPFWEMIASDPENSPTFKKAFPVNVVLKNVRFYGHFEILDRKDTLAERAAKTATFLLATVFDPIGYATMLGGLDQTTLYIDGGSAKPGKPIQILSANLNGVYANAEGGPTPNPEDPSDPDLAICQVMDGPYGPPSADGGQGTGTVTGGIVKRYGVDPPGGG